MKTSKKLIKVISLSAIGLIAFTSIGVGTTFALFTNQSKTVVNTSSGSISSSTSISLVEARSGSLNPYESISGNFYTLPSNGTVSINETSEISLNNLAKGDSVKVRIDLTNNSTIHTKYKFEVLSTGNLKDLLEISYDASSRFYKRLKAGNNTFVECNLITITYKEDSTSTEALNGQLSLNYDMLQANAITFNSTNISNIGGVFTLETSDSYKNNDYFDIGKKLDEDNLYAFEFQGINDVSDVNLVSSYEIKDTPSALLSFDFSTSSIALNLGTKKNDIVSSFTGDNLELSFYTLRNLENDEIEFYMNNTKIDFSSSLIYEKDFGVITYKISDPSILDLSNIFTIKTKI